MKILYIVPSLIQAGPVNVVHDLVRVMTNHNHECTVAFIENRNDRKQNKFPCQVIIASQIEWDSYDVIHTHGFRPDLLARKNIPGKKRYKLVSTMHNLVFEENRIRFGIIKGFIYSWLELWAAKSHRNIITLTNSAKEYYKKYFITDRLNVCCNTRFITPEKPNPSDVEAITNFKKSNKIKYLIGAHCSFTHRKGLEQTIKVLANFTDVGLLLIGDGPQENLLKEEVKSRGMTNKVLFLGRRDNAARYIPLLDIFVIPSRSEGFPLSLLEAAAMGKASVSSDIEVFKTTFPEDDTLPKFPLDDIDAFAETIKKALANREELGRRIKDKFDQCYSPEAFYQQHMAVYNKALNNK